MWGDPWGGWAFGSRYLIPGYALICIFLSLVLSRFRKNLVFLSIFFIVGIYSLSVNTLGALTTNRVPPKIEVQALEELSNKKERFSIDRNWEHLNTYGLKSFVFNAFANQIISAGQYYYLVTLLLIALFLSTTSGLYISKGIKKNT